MKKYMNYIILLIVTILFIPNVYASNSIEIDSINLVDISENVIEFSKPSINNTELGFDLSFIDINDYAKYKVEIVNNSTKTYYIDNENKFSDSDYINYIYEFEDDINKITPNSKITMYITLKYAKQVPIDKIENGMYKESNNMSIDLTDVVLSDPTTYTNLLSNPKTSSNILLILLIIGIIVLVVKKKKKSIGISIIIFILLLIPLTIYALERFTIKADTKITVEEQRNIIESRYLNGNTNTERDFWQYIRYIKTVTFEAKIEEPSNYTYKFDVSEAKNNSIIAYLIPNEDPSFYDLYIMSNGYIYANPDSSYVFYLFQYLNSINNLENFKTIYATNMQGMFSYTTSLEELDLSHFDTSNVTNMTSMFAWMKNIEELDLSSFETSNVTTMEGMFNQEWDGYVKNKLKSINVSSFNTKKVTNMSYMFASCEMLENLYLSNFDTSNVTKMDRMFSSCVLLKELDLSSFNTNNVTSMRCMFISDNNLENIYVSSKWNTENVNDSFYMFYYCNKLPNYNENIIDKTNANTSNTGYLTLKS